MNAFLVVHIKEHIHSSYEKKLIDKFLQPHNNEGEDDHFGLTHSHELTQWDGVKCNS